MYDQQSSVHKEWEFLCPGRGKFLHTMHVGIVLKALQLLSSFGFFIV